VFSAGGDPGGKNGIGEIFGSRVPTGHISIRGIKGTSPVSVFVSWGSSTPLIQARPEQGGPGPVAAGPWGRHGGVLA